MNARAHSLGAHAKCVARHCVTGAALNTLGISGLFGLYAATTAPPFNHRASFAPSYVAGDVVVVAVLVAVAHLPVIAASFAAGCALWRVGPGRANRVVSSMLGILVVSGLLALLGATDDMRQALHELYLGEDVVLVFPVLGVLAIASPLIFSSQRARVWRWVCE